MMQKSMELLTPVCSVLLSRIVQPIIFYQHNIYCLIIDPAGRFVSASRPAVLDLCGEPVQLQAEIPYGSAVRVHTVDGYLRTVQIIRRKLVNPFATAA